MLDRLFALETFGIKLGLENIAQLCAALGHPERHFASLHIAGTNGKGSVAAMVHAALVAGGYRASRYTSPHLSDITERFVVGDRPIAISSLENAAEQVLDCADDLQASGALRVPPTFFEAATATAFEVFRRADVEVAVIEVGLGGRFDATNVITPVAGAITTIGFDHQQHLGNSLAQIAFEKAGIIKPAMPVVIGALPDEAREVVLRVAAERGADAIEASSGVDVTVEMTNGLARMRMTTPNASYGPVLLGLRGAHQVSNALVAVRLLEAARAGGIALAPDAIVQGLAEPNWPARLELFELDDRRRVLLDAAHNVDGASALADYIRQWHAERPRLVLGVMHDKDVDAMLRALLPVVSGVTATAASSPRAMAPEVLALRAAAVAADLYRSWPPGTSPIEIELCHDPEDAVRRALERCDMVCVAGSIFLAGAVREGLRRRAILR